MAKDSTEWEARQGWVQNFRKFRFLNLILPLLTPIALVSIFLFGYFTFGAIAIFVALLAWFEYSIKAKKPSTAVAWRAAAVLLTPWGLWMLVLQFVPSWR